jgi:acylphosphatase
VDGAGGVADLTPATMIVLVRGAVQGVGFRWWTRCRALELGLVGSATNLPDGRVEVIATGPRGACVELHRLLSARPAPPVPPAAPRSYYRRPGRVDGTSVSWQVITDGELVEHAGRGFVER